MIVFKLFLIRHKHILDCFVLSLDVFWISHLCAYAKNVFPAFSGSTSFRKLKLQKTNIDKLMSPHGYDIWTEWCTLFLTWLCLLMSLSPFCVLESWSSSRTETWTYWNWSGGPGTARATSTVRFRHGSAAMPWTSTALLVFSASWQLEWCFPVSSPWWKAGGHGGRDPGSPPRRYGGWMGKWKQETRYRELQRAWNKTPIFPFV